MIGHACWLARAVPSLPWAFSLCSRTDQAAAGHCRCCGVDCVPACGPLTSQHCTGGPAQMNGRCWGCAAGDLLPGIIHLSPPQVTPDCSFERPACAAAVRQVAWCLFTWQATPEQSRVPPAGAGPRKTGRASVCCLSWRCSLSACSIPAGGGPGQRHRQGLLRTEPPL